MEQQTQAYKIFTRIALNNWHYIDRKVLGLNQSINFFTGHSGSGKSTVIDAMQIVLYANTDGRGFFNKAAADDSDRSLIEYLRGMINIGENNQVSYRRNQNFSSTIVLEMEQSATKEKECIGVVFDVETATNEVNRLFFWHKGAMIPGEYRTESRTMTIGEVRDYLQKHFSREEYFYTSNNEHFRRNLYDVYLGGLDMEKFPRLFKRAIPFRMNIRLEDFVKEYICMEQDIHIEEMQESVQLYGRMCRKIEAAMEEIRELGGIGEQYQLYAGAKEKEEELSYRRDKLSILKLKEEIQRTQEQLGLWQEDLALLRQQEKETEGESADLEETYHEINIQLTDTGYALLEEKLRNLEETYQRLGRSEEKWRALSEKLEVWEEVESVSNQTLNDIEKFRDGKVSAEEIGRLKKALLEVHQEADGEQREAASEIRALKKEAKLIESELSELRSGKTAYPKELTLARAEIEKQLYEKLGKRVQVRILADLLEIRDEKWRNAIEGFLGWNKLALIVEPKYVKEAMAIYETLDPKKYWRVSVVDTERIQKEEHQEKSGSLSEEVKVSESYVKAYVDYLLGNVQKCEDIEELRKCRTGVTADCRLYQNYQLRRLSPDNYTKFAYIGEKSKQRRQKELSAQLEKLNEGIEGYKKAESLAAGILAYEYLPDATEDYRSLLEDVKEKKQKEKELVDLRNRMEELNLGIVEELKTKREEITEKQKTVKEELDRIKRRIWDKERSLENGKSGLTAKNEELVEAERVLRGSKKDEEAFAAYIGAYPNPRYIRLLEETDAAIEESLAECEKEKNTLVEVRTAYLKNHPQRDFSASAPDNSDYQKLLEELQCGELEDYRKKAADQAKSAVEHFKEDFIFKIRSAIREAYVRRDELNRIIRNLDFGKDRYQFRIGRKKGRDGEFYDMFMDEDLNIDPASLSPSVEHQMNLFSLNHQNKYGTMIRELLELFIPPENATAAELEESRKNMEKYADYRTYLSFEMEQIVEGDEQRLVIGLSKMIKKNSGGEGQNPLYIALLASFAQAYRINLSARASRRPTIRLVVLDEAFSKMDAEKVASCIDLIRSLGFQAIISATNDKIQNYIENVDKTFVYANPNKKNISIQEFEKKDFGELVTEFEE